MKNFFLILLVLISLNSFAQFPTIPMGAKVSDTALWKTNGANVYNKNTGFVGIGTITPIEKLHVIGNAIFYTNGAASAINPLQIQTGQATTDKRLYVQTGAIELQSNETNATLPVFKINSSGTYRLVALANGNVGIGTTTPTDKLSVYNSKVATATATPEAINLGGTFSNSAGNNLKLKLFDDGANIGGLGISAGQMYYKVWATNADHVYYAGASEVMRIKGTGNVGIGTTTPTSKLDVNGESSLRGVVSTGINLEVALLGTGNRNSFIDFHSQDGVDYNARILRNPGVNGDFLFPNRGTGNIKIDAENVAGEELVINGISGNVGIGTNAPAQKLHVLGNILASGTITPSDKRLKSNIKDVTYGLTDLLKLKAVSYTKKFSLEKNETGEVKEIGFIAQDLQKVLPELVTENGADKLLAVNYTSIIPILVKAIQEQQKEIEALKAKIK